MAIYTNVVREFRDQIEQNLELNDVIDVLIAQRLVDEKLYNEIWSYQKNRIRYLLDIILKDGKRCAKFIDILGNITLTKQLSKTIKSDIEKIRRIIVVGGFPEFSLNYVVRNSVANKIENKALDLNPSIGSILVVYGLPGFGKSCLVNQVLQTKRFLEVSGGAMFWINLGEHSDTTTVINPLWNLYLNAVKLTNRPSLVHRPDEILVLQNELRRMFLEDELKKAFLILDDVKSAEVLDVFKLKCKLVITTQDKNVANNSEAFFIKVTTGFTQKESIELLRKSLEIDELSSSKEKLASKIHELCDGCPMLLNIIGSILKDSREEALTSDLMWDGIIDEMRRNDRLEHPTTTNVINMIQKFVTCLTPSVQKYFHSLAVFPKHVNIRPEILMKLWNQNHYTVRKVMVELENKSLVVSFFNKDLQSYVYSIHSLVRTYLVDVAQTDVLDYHRKLISQFEDVLDRPPTEDPSANYIFGYFGYHAKNAKLFDKFEKYFDLSFIENKIKRVGSADLLTDFDVYREYITKFNVLLERKLQDYINFVNSYSAHLHVSPETNIVQFAFFNDNSYVYEEAKVIAGDNPDQLYFKLEQYSGKNKKFPILKAKSVITAVCFVDSKEVLVGTASGVIETKSFRQYQHKVSPFEGHKERITFLQIRSDKKTFLSISLDESLILWRFADDLDPQSPKYKQRNWKNLHSPDDSFDQHKVFKMQEGDFILSASFPNDNTDEIVTGSNQGRIVRWNTRNGTIIQQSPGIGLKVPRILYSHNNQYIIFSCDGKIFLYSRELTYSGQFGILQHLQYFNEMLLAPQGVVIMSGKLLEVWDYSERKKLFQFESKSKISSAVVQGDQLIFGGVNHIYMYSFKLGEVSHFHNEHGEPSCIYALPDRIAYVSIDRDLVRRCELSLEINENPIVNNLTLFDCFWNQNTPIYFTIGEQNKIDIFNGHATILSAIHGITNEIRTAVFSPCGNYLILGTENGIIYFYNYKKNSLDKINVCTTAITLIKTFEVDDNLEIVDSYNLYGLVVAASQRKIVVISEKSVKLEFDVSTQISYVFYLCNNLIGIDVKNKIFYGRLFSETNMWRSEQYHEVIGAAVHNTKHLMAVIAKTTNLHSLNVFEFHPEQAKSIKFTSALENEAKCVSFSATGKFIAVGFVSGVIEIFNLENGRQDFLNVHKRAVKQVVFAPNIEPILVSVGDQIAWWNLQALQNIDKTNGVGHFKRQLSVLTFDNWTTKKLHESVPYLITSTNFHGKQVKYISTSKDFKSFLIVDEDGNIFKMDIIVS